MTSTLSAPAAKTAAPGPRIYSVGTLRYTLGGLCTLFFLLLWNDVILMLMEQVPRLTALIWIDNGASQTQMALWGSLTGPLTIWINPVFSTWSDRCRTRMGRRRPFLLFAAPPCALFLALTPFMPDIARWLTRGTEIGVWMSGSGSALIFLLLTLCTLCFAVFNTIILSIFSCYFWDVVPQPVLGRFQSLAKMAGVLAASVFNYFIFGLSEKHMHAVFVVIAALFAVVYVATVLLVKEGEYPPPEPRPHSRPRSSGGNGGAWEARGKAVWSYLRDCFGDRKYLWVFGTFILIQVGNQAGSVRYLLQRYQLNMDMDTIGKMDAWGGPAVLLLGFPLGALIDRLGAMRMIAPCLLMWCLANVGAFFFVQGPWSMLACTMLITLTNFAYIVCVGALTVEVFPRAKLGQFCSANSIAQQIVCWGTVILAGQLFDRLGLGKYHYVYLWAAGFELLGVIGFLKIYGDWKRGRYAQPAEAQTADSD